MPAPGGIPGDRPLGVVLIVKFNMAEASLPSTAPPCCTTWGTRLNCMGFMNKTGLLVPVMGAGCVAKLNWVTPTLVELLMTIFSVKKAELAIISKVLKNLKNEFLGSSESQNSMNMCKAQTLAKKPCQ